MRTHEGVVGIRDAEKRLELCDAMRLPRKIVFSQDGETTVRVLNCLFSLNRPMHLLWKLS